MEASKRSYSIGDMVYLITDREQLERIITAILLTDKDIRYKLSCGVEDTWHYGMELSWQKNRMKHLW